MTVMIHCGTCNGTFDFEHPSVQGARDMANITITCSWCGAILKTPADEIHMINIAEYQRRQLVRQGIIEDNPADLRIVTSSPTGT